MRYKLKWRAAGEGPLSPEVFNSVEDARKRGRELIARYHRQLVADVWNEDETWQVVTPAGFEDWCEMA